MKCNVLNRSSVDQDSAVLPFSFQINKSNCMLSVDVLLACCQERSTYGSGLCSFGGVLWCTGGS